MKSRLALFALLAIVLILGRIAGRATRSTADSEPHLAVSGPYTHENLTIFLLHGPDASQTHNLLTLQEAIEQNLVVVHETGSVNELAVENNSGDCDVFIQSGDIVKGGRQDRLIASDLLLPPRSGVIPVAAFCVEQGRWSGRRGEAAVVFNSSTSQAMKPVKFAVASVANQSEVWKQVADTQTKLSANLGKAVNDPSSPTSLQLALEDKDVTAKLAKYEAALAKLLDGRENVIGFAFAINGKVEGADVYGSAALFRKLWPKLLRTAATDALAEFKKDQTMVALAKSDVRVFLNSTSEGREKQAGMASDQFDAFQTVVTSVIETRTGTFMFGLGINTDGGQTGTLDGNSTTANERARMRAQVADRNSRMLQVIDLSESMRQLPITDTFALPAQPQLPVQPTRLRVTQTANDRGLMVESRDRSGGAVIHRSYIAK